MRLLHLFAFLLLFLSGSARAADPLEEATRLYETALAALPAYIEEHGEAEIKANIDRHRMAIEEKGIGRSQLRLVAGVISIRVVHEASGIAFDFLDPRLISPEDPELRRYLAETHVNSGTSSAVRQNGRNAVFVWISNEAVERVEEKPRPGRFSSEWWSDWKLATLHKPTSGDVALGVACGITYGGLALCISTVRHFTQDVPIAFDPALFTSIWSLTYGTFVQTLSSFTLRGTASRHVFKQMGLSMGFNYTVMFLSHGFMHTMTIHDPAALLAHFSVVSQVAVNSMFSFNVRMITKLREDAGVNSEPILIPLPSGKSIEIDRAATERNMIGVMTFPLSALDVMGAGTLIPGTNLPMPLGKVAMLGLIPVVRRAALWTSEHFGVDVETNRLRWESWLPVRMWKGVKDYIGHPYSLPPDECGRFLMKDSWLLKPPGAHFLPLAPPPALATCA